MWDKFWESFYTKGTEAIDRLNSWLGTYVLKDKDIQAITDLITGVNESGDSGVKIIDDKLLADYIKAIEKRKDTDNELIQNIQEIESEIEKTKQKL